MYYIILYTLPYISRSLFVSIHLFLSLFHFLLHYPFLPFPFSFPFSIGISIYMPGDQRPRRTRHKVHHTPENAVLSLDLIGLSSNLGLDWPENAPMT